MKLRTLLVLLSLSFVFAACGEKASGTGTPGESGTPADAPGNQTSDVTGAANSVVTLLKGITDGPTAEAAKTELASLTGKLSGALGALKSATGEGAGEAKNALGDLAKKAMSKLSPEVTQSLAGIKDQIARLMGNVEITKVIGPMLEKLKGLLPS